MMIFPFSLMASSVGVADWAAAPAVRQRIIIRHRAAVSVFFMSGFLPFLCSMLSSVRMGTVYMHKYSLSRGKNK